MPGCGATSFINGITEFAPGAKIAFHSHNCEESVMLLEGHAILDIDGEEHELKPLDTTWIPPNLPHRFRNLSETQPMKILWIYASVNATRTLTESGETRPIAAEHRGGRLQPSTGAEDDGAAVRLNAAAGICDG
jgi:mannose-6-phosphate isomerase-like protein (cupin superfamily)